MTDNNIIGLEMIDLDMSNYTDIPRSTDKGAGKEKDTQFQAQVICSSQRNDQHLADLPTQTANPQSQRRLFHATSRKLSTSVATAYLITSFGLQCSDGRILEPL